MRYELNHIKIINLFYVIAVVQTLTQPSIIQYQPTIANNQLGGKYQLSLNNMQP